VYPASHSHASTLEALAGSGTRELVGQEAHDSDVWLRKRPSGHDSHAISRPVAQDKKNITPRAFAAHETRQAIAWSGTARIYERRLSRTKQIVEGLAAGRI